MSIADHASAWQILVRNYLDTNLSTCLNLVKDFINAFKRIHDIFQLFSNLLVYDSNVSLLAAPGLAAEIVSAACTGMGDQGKQALHHDVIPALITLVRH